MLKFEEGVLKRKVMGKGGEPERGRYHDVRRLKQEEGGTMRRKLHVTIRSKLTRP